MGFCGKPLSRSNYSDQTTGRTGLECNVQFCIYEPYAEYVPI